MRRQSHAGVSKVLYIMVAVFLLAMGAVTSLTIHNNYTSTVGAAEKQGLIYTRTLAEHASRTFGEADRILDTVMDDVARQGGISAFKEQQLTRLFAAHIHNAPQISSVFAVDADGGLTATTSAYPAHHLDVSEREYFRFHRDNPKAESFVSRPYLNRLSKTWRFSLSRRLTGTDGSFKGLIGVTLGVNYFDSFYTTLFPITTQRISLLRTDGSYLVIAPFNEKAMSQNIGNQPLFTSHLQAHHEGTFHNPQEGSDATDRIVSYCKAPGRYPVVAVVSFEKQAILAGWYRETIEDGLVAILLTAAVIALAIILGRRMRQLEHSELVIREEKERTKTYLDVVRDRENLVSSLLDAVPESMMLIDPGGIILAINKTAAHRLGSEPDRMISTPIWDYLPADLAEARRELLAKTLSTRQAVQFEDQRDNYHFFHVNTPIIDPSMQVRRVAILAFDVTESRQTQAALRESEETFRKIFSEAPDPILLIDDSNCFVECNEAAVRMLGATSQEQVLMRHPSFFSPELQPDGQVSSQKAETIIRTVFEQQDMHFEWLHHRLDGTEFFVDTSLKLIFLHGRKMQLVHWRDITDRKQTENTLHKLSTAVEQSPAAIVITDANGAIEYVNPKFCHMTGYAVDEVLGRNPRVLKSDTLPEEFYRELWETILAGQEWQGEFHNRSKQGRLFWEKACISPIKNASGTITSFVAVKEDITERKHLQEQLAQMAHFDSLTGLPNRALFFDRTSQAITLAKRENRRCSVLFIDLDGFKDVNDTYGHETGDQLLCHVAERIKSILRASDTVARMGGDEFTVILASLKQRNDAARVAEKILTQLSQPFAIGTAICHIGASIGISIFPDDAEDAEKLLHGADTAMYAVKRSGKNNYCFFLNS